MDPLTRDLIGLLLASRPCVAVGSLASALFISEARARRLVDELLSYAGDSINVNDNVVCVSNPVSLALAGVRMGVPEPEVARYLDWRDFEGFAAGALEAAGFTVYRGLRLRAPPMEVDVLGVGESIALAIDCKRWSYRASSPSRLAEAAAAQVRRAEALALYGVSLGLPRGCRHVIPALLVLREDLPQVLEGALVIPVSRLRGAIESIYEALGDERVVKFRACW